MANGKPGVLGLRSFGIKKNTVVVVFGCWDVPLGRDTVDGRNPEKTTWDV